MNTLIPTWEIFREVIIEMLKNRIIDIAEIEFQLNKSILEIINNNNSFKKIAKIKVEKIYGNYNVKLEVLRNATELVKELGQASKCYVKKYGGVVYMIPKEVNDFIGYSKGELKRILYKYGSNDKYYYWNNYTHVLCT